MLIGNLRKRKRTPPPVSTVFMITLVLFICMVVGSIIFINKGIKPAIMDIAEVKTTEFATRGINAAVRFSEDYDFKDIMHVELNNDGYVSTMSFDAAKVGEINRVSTDRVEEFFKLMNEGKRAEEDSDVDIDDYGNIPGDMRKEDPTVVEIPVGMATGNSVLANLGPKIPVNLEFVGNVKTDVKTDEKDIGINGTLITIYVLVEAEVQVIIPFATSVKDVSTKIYVAKSVIMGDVPNFYGGGSDGPPIAIPKDAIDDENDAGEDE